MQNNDCIHNFSDWKKEKKPVLDCESMEEDARTFIWTKYTRKCRNCGLVDSKLEKINKKGNNKKLGLNMKRRK